MSQTPIVTPARFAAPYAVGFSDAAGTLNLVSATAPLPVTLSAVAAAPMPLTGTTTASGTVGPFVPGLGLPITLTLRGIWQGQIKVFRSVDGGITLDPLTVGGVAWAVFSANACEAVWEENDSSGTLYLGIALTSGSLTYRLGH